MLTYQDVVTANLIPLTTAAVAWDGMADAFEDLGEAYRGSVEGATTDGGWMGISADPAKDDSPLQGSSSRPPLLRPEL